CLHPPKGQTQNNACTDYREFHRSSPQKKEVNSAKGRNRIKTGQEIAYSTHRNLRAVFLRPEKS
ncbi:hypothetical protein, partial [Pseudomonas savastanoi]|uniref:hypothetical protein n=1 Tax=Pseudomonas savastanoi TaxID=29438 RepID=UPI001C7F4875